MITVKPYDNSTGKYGEEYTETLTIGRTDGDMTYVKYKEQVFKVSSDIISFANDSSYNIVSKLQALVDISEVKSVTVEYNGAEHTIDITHNDSDMTFVLDGQKVDTKITQAIYKSIVGLAVDGVYKDETLGDTVMKIKYKGIGIRVVYSLVSEEKIMNIVVISQRDDEYCYEIAAKLYNKYGDDIFSNMFSE